MNERRPSEPSLVLVIEDDPVLMFTLVDFVEEAGCEAIEAFNMADALRIRERRTDIRTVFTDLDMRGSPAGLVLAQAIRDRWPPIELVMVGSLPYHSSELPARGVLLGKPFDSRKIIKAIQTFAA